MLYFKLHENWTVNKKTVILTELMVQLEKLNLQKTLIWSIDVTFQVSWKFECKLETGYFDQIVSRFEFEKIELSFKKDWFDL